MDSQDSDEDLLVREKRPRLSSHPSSLGQQGPSSSSMGSNCNRSSSPAVDLSPLGQEGTTSSSLNRIRSSKYDVFISFRGTDTRNTFVDHLYHHLIRKGIFVFKDDQSLQKGDLISPKLLQAIQDSRLSIVVFSRDYASSSWCLDELATIAECHQQFKQTVFPVFYHVDPSHVRNQNGVYNNAFVSHTRRFRREPAKVDRWKRAMTKLGNSAGWPVTDDDPESSTIQKIVQAVIKKLNHRFSGFADDLIGIQPQIEELEKLLKLDSENDDFRVLGIWGMGGIGKTTHATALYDRISYQFVACCFIENVSKTFRDGGATAVHKQILRQTLGESNLEAYGPSEISGMVRNRLHNLKVVIVLDNVDQLEQLQELAIDPKLLHTGSRMIITTRDKHILNVYGAQGVYEVPLLNSNAARALLCKKAFKSEDQSSNCVELIPEILEYTECLPLAIKVLGSFLCTRNFLEWGNALNRLRDNPGNNKIMEALEISVEGLHPKEREIFLHIACFFKGEREDYIKRILDSCGLYPHIGIPSIIEKSLITIKNQEIHVHEMLQEVGKKIVRGQYVENPAWWSRLWRYSDLYDVIMTQEGKAEVEAIVLRKQDNVSMPMAEADGLSKMRNLKLLIFYENRLSVSLSLLSNKLQYFFWHGYPFASLPSNFQPYRLLELNMPDSNIQHLWEGRKFFASLERVDLSNSKCLIETPDFELSRGIKRLDLTGCTNLLRLHPSIGFLAKLTFLSLRNCSSLVSIDFPSGVCSLSSLIVLHLSGCTKLGSTPNFFTGASNLEYLDMDRCTSLSTIHQSIGSLSKLRFLSMRECTTLESIPSFINSMTSLITLDFYGCSKLGKLENHNLVAVFNSFCPESLISMDLSFCDLHEVPDGIGELSCLERLNLQGNKFVSLPDTISKLSALAYLNLSHCHKLQSLPNLPSSSSSKVGRYFTTTAGSRDHRSGLHIFDCPNVKEFNFIATVQFKWLRRLLQEPRHFRCGFDIILPYHQQNTNPIIQDSLHAFRELHHTTTPRFHDSIQRRTKSNRCFQELRHTTITPHFHDNIKRPTRSNRGFDNVLPYHQQNTNPIIQEWLHHVFRGNSIIRVVHCDVDDNWIGFLFYVEFEALYYSSSPLPHPFYLSFEDESTEQRFDMPLNSDLDKIHGSGHTWTIYISREHCHFIETRADITFKACPGLVVKSWGLRRIVKEDLEVLDRIIEATHLKELKVRGRTLKEMYLDHAHAPSSNKEGFVIEHVEQSSNNNCGPKFQLPYNWLVTEEDEVENLQAKAKENSLSNLGL